MNDDLHIGIIGAGGFAAFAAQNFIKVPGVKIAGVFDINNEAAEAFAKKNNARRFDDIDTLLHDGNIDLVYIATPPFLHYGQSHRALLAGKHVICEKPAALKTSEAEELYALAESKELLYVVNLMQRYNPLYEMVDRIVKEKILGSFLHGYFENYASDESLHVDHWFWDDEKSGGIFIEHGVHFFDMFSGWLGEGKVINAIQQKAPTWKGEMTDRVQATVMYPEGTVHFYHGFDQPDMLDRQELRLQFERGEITLYGWIPVEIKLHAVVKDEQLKYLQELFPGAEVSEHALSTLVKHSIKGRGRDIEFDKEVTLTHGNVGDKQKRYEQLMVSMLTDQWKWMRDHNHERIIDGGNAVASLRLAEDATKMAQTI